jgi:hypothetical protein
MSDTRAYARWKAMRQRCSNPQHKDYRHYGARGIGIHPDWENFIAYYVDTGDAPHGGLSLDRPDNDADYGPANYAWADKATQLANRRPYRKKSKITKRPRRGDADDGFGPPF